MKKTSGEIEDFAQRVRKDFEKHKTSYLKEFQDLAPKLGIFKIDLSGSYAKGKMSEHSDIDVAVHYTSDVDPYQVAEQLSGKVWGVGGYFDVHPICQKKSAVRLGEQDVKIVTLDSPNQQAQGFQYYNEIPKTYGFLFPNSGKGYFHMYNVGAPLLMVALDNEHKVVGKEIRQPNTAGKPVAGGKGTHILELHPDYDDWITVGRRIAQNTFEIRYWLTPQCEFVKVKDHIRDLMDKGYLDYLYEQHGENFDPWDAYEEAFKHGSVRVTLEIAPGKRTLYFEGNPTQKQLKALKDFAIEKNAELVSDRYGQITPDNPNIRKLQFPCPICGEMIHEYWRTPSGKIVEYCAPKKGKDTVINDPKKWRSW